MGWLKLVAGRPLPRPLLFRHRAPTREQNGRKKKSVSQNSEAMAVTRRLAPSFFEIWATHQNPLKSVRYEGFAGGLKKKVVVDILVVAFMSPENRGRPGPARPRPGLAWLRPSVAATQPLCGFHTDHAVRRGRHGRHGRHARKSEATGIYPRRPHPRTHTHTHTHTPKIATPRCGGTSVKGASRHPAAHGNRPDK